jgi:hypothetical protein
MRRFTWLTNGFSTKVQNLEHAVAFTSCTTTPSRVHQSFRVTPAMAAGLADHVWDLDALGALTPKPVAKPCGSMKRAASVG